MQVETRDTETIETMIKRYESLKLRMNSFSVSAPLRLKAAVREEMRAIGEDLNAIGLELDYFGRWV
jgi:hypothetical protein